MFCRVPSLCGAQTHGTPDVSVCPHVLCLNVWASVPSESAAMAVVLCLVLGLTMKCVFGEGKSESPFRDKADAVVGKCFLQTAVPFLNI